MSFVGRCLDGSAFETSDDCVAALRDMPHRGCYSRRYPLSELADRGYDAMMSRLRDGASVITMTAPDYRRAA